MASIVLPAVLRQPGDHVSAAVLIPAGLASVVGVATLSASDRADPTVELTFGVQRSADGVTWAPEVSAGFRGSPSVAANPTFTLMQPPTGTDQWYRVFLTILGRAVSVGLTVTTNG